MPASDHGDVGFVADDAAHDDVGFVETPASARPGALASAAKWLTTPFAGMKPIIEAHRKESASAPAGLVDRNSSDLVAGTARFLSGAMPGARPEDMPGETAARMERFDSEHPKVALGLGLAGGLGNPTNAVLPTAPAAAAGPGFLETTANKLAARTLKGTAGEYKELGKEGTQKMGAFLLDKGATRFGSSAPEVAERAAKLPGATGEALGASIEALDQTGAQVSKRALAGQFQALEADALKQGPGAAPLAAKYRAAAEAVLKDIMESGQEMMSFKQAELWKRAYQAPINYSKMNNTPLEMGAKEIASAARQGVEDAAGVAGEGTQLGENFLRAKEESGLAQQAAKMAKGAEGRRTARNMASPSSVATSLTAMLAAVGSGHPMAAVPALLAGPAMQVVRNRAPAAAAVALKASAGIAEKLAAAAPAALGRYGPLLKSVAQDPDALAAHLYVIGQTDPKESDNLRKALETP